MFRKAKPLFTPRPKQLSAVEQIQQAAGAGRHQQALELAKRLYRDERTDAHRTLLEKTYLDYARNLRQLGRTHDARAVLEAARKLEDQSASWLKQLAEELAASGLIDQALAVSSSLPDDPARTRLLAHAADAAIQNGPTARQQLPAALQADCARIVQAFADSAAGKDEAVAAGLQTIGLRSPFLEWKLYLRGLQAYYLNDDARALENWQRLDGTRLPARLAAPLRSVIDPPYWAAQPAAAQSALQKKADLVQGTTAVTTLREIQVAMARDGNLKNAFRLAEALLPALKQQSPRLVPRLGSCFYWAIINPGCPEDIPKYKRLFGPPPDDPTFARLNAIGFERGGEMDVAHKFWQEFEKVVSEHPQAWPPGQAATVRALVWTHMGRNALEAAEDEQDPEGFAFPGKKGARTVITPSAEICFKRSLQLYPEQLEAAADLFEFYRANDKIEQAVTTGEALLARYPEHVPTLEALADCYTTVDRLDEALALLKRALRANPLDRSLRERVGLAHLALGRDHALLNRLDEARAEFETALTYQTDPKGRTGVWFAQAAVEFKAKNLERAEAVLAQATGVVPPLAVAFAMLIEATTLKIPPALKTRFNREFTAGLGGTIEPEALVALMKILANLEVQHVEYHGRKTHQKKILDAVQRALGKLTSFTEAQFEQLGQAVSTLRVAPLLLKLAQEAHKKFPSNPLFLVHEVVAQVVKGRPSRVWQLLDKLKEAERLIERGPATDKTKDLSTLIHLLTEKLKQFMPFGGAFLEAFDRMFDGQNEGFDF